MGYIKIIHPESGNSLILFDNGKPYLDVLPAEIQINTIEPSPKIQQLNKNMDKLNQLKDELDSYNKELNNYKTIIKEKEENNKTIFTKAHQKINKKNIPLTNIKNKAEIYLILCGIIIILLGLLAF